jgi:hypothetical protein
MMNKKILLSMLAGMNFSESMMVQQPIVTESVNHNMRYTGPSNYNSSKEMIAYGCPKTEVCGKKANLLMTIVICVICTYASLKLIYAILATVNVRGGAMARAETFFEKLTSF